MGFKRKDWEDIRHVVINRIMCIKEATLEIKRSVKAIQKEITIIDEFIKEKEKEIGTNNDKT